MNVYILMVQWEDGESHIAGVFSSFTSAVQYFVRTEFADSTMPIPEMQSMVANIALKFAHKTEDGDWANFGRKRAWIEECEVDEHCENYEITPRKQGE